MAEPLEETPRGVELQSLLAQGVNQVISPLHGIELADRALQSDDLKNAITYTLGSLTQLRYATEKLFDALETLGMRGFFDDNRMELTMHVLSQLKETKNGGTK